MSRRGNGSFEMRSLSSESLPLTSPLRRHVSIFYRVIIVLTDPSRSLPALLVHRSSNPGNRIRFRPNLLSLKATAEVSNMLHWIYFLSLSQSVSLLFILSCLCTILVFCNFGYLLSSLVGYLSNNNTRGAAESAKQRQKKCEKGIRVHERSAPNTIPS